MGEYLNRDAMKNLLAKELFGKAVSYLRNHWEALQVVCVTNPAVPIDNNETEPLMQQVAVSPKSRLFIGRIAAGRREANLITAVSSVLRNDLDVWIYIKSVLDVLISGSTGYTSLRSRCVGPAHRERICRYRQEERRNRAGRK